MSVHQVRYTQRQIAISVISMPMARKTRLLVQCELLYSVIEETVVQLLGPNTPVEHLVQLQMLRFGLTTLSVKWELATILIL